MRLNKYFENTHRTYLFNKHLYNSYGHCFMRNKHLVVGVRGFDFSFYILEILSYDNYLRCFIFKK